MRAIDKRIARLQAMSLLTRHGYPKASAMSAAQVAHRRWWDHYSDYQYMRRLLDLQMQLPDKQHPNIRSIKQVMWRALNEMREDRIHRGKVLP